MGIKEMLTASRKDNERLRAENARLLRWNRLLRDSLRQAGKHGHVGECESCRLAVLAADAERA